MLNFAPACERNKSVILTELSPIFSQCRSVFEIGSYSGQHAIHFCQAFPGLSWQPSDIEENLAALQENIRSARLGNCNAPIALDVARKSDWPQEKFDIIFSANTLHIMSWPHVEALFNSLPHVSAAGSWLCIYGPFKYQGRYTSASNAEFQRWLKGRDMNSGIRDFERVHQLVSAQGFELYRDIAMPANNQLLIWQKE